MQATESIQPPLEAVQSRPAFVLRVEWLAYAVLIVLAAVLRLAALGDVALSPAEAREALAAWRTVQPSEAPPIVPQSPLVFAVQKITFSTLGGGEFAARLGTALAGIALVALPLLFADVLGRPRALLLSALLAFSPVMIAASRDSSPSIWSLLLAGLALWGMRRYWVTLRNGAAQQGYGIFAIAALAALALLSEPAGFLLVLALIAAFLIAANTEDATEGGPALEVRSALAGFPFVNGLAVAALTIFLIGTSFMLYPQGMGAVGELVGGAFSGFFTRDAAAMPMAALGSSLFYELWLWIFAGVGVIAAVRGARFGFVERFGSAWLLLVLIAALLYARMDASNAVWLTVPLALLVSGMIVPLFTDNAEGLLWSEQNAQQRVRALAVGRGIAALCMIALMFMLGLHLRVLAEALITVPGEGLLEPISELFSRLGDGQFIGARVSVIWLSMTVLFIIVGFFLGSSVWGGTTTAQGAALGVMIFFLFTGVAGGWRIAVSGATDPVELWHMQATHQSTALLRQTLLEIADRASGGEPEIPVYAMVAPDSVVAWVLRDFRQTRFISSIDEATLQGIVILPVTPEPPNLGGNYVGQQFVIVRGWTNTALSPYDLLAWWTLRQVRFPSRANEALEVSVLWLRQDVYNGIPEEGLP
jgi:hypothetical protein